MRAFACSTSRPRRRPAPCSTGSIAAAFAGRPMPKLGETAEEQAERRREALAWGLETGAARAIVQAYRQARQRGESELTAFNAAADAALALGRDWAEKAMHD